MIADLNILQFESSSFAKLICMEQAIDSLSDSTLYVLTKGKKEWDDAVDNINESEKHSQARGPLSLSFSVAAIADLPYIESDDILPEYLDCVFPQYNLIMPLFTPDRGYKCYFIGRVSEIENLNVEFKMLISDAQMVCDECSFAAFATSIETAPDEAKKVWKRIIGYNSRIGQPDGNSSRGKYNTTVGECTFLGPGFEKMVKNAKIKYADLITSLKKFPDTVEALSKSTSNNSSDVQMEYVKICHSLSAVDKNELLLELSKRIKDKKIIAEAIDAVINKAKYSRLKIVLVGDASVDKIDGRRMYGCYYTFLVDENGNRQWLDFEPAAHVIYVMNLINRINNPDTPDVVDVTKQEEAFLAIYAGIYTVDGKEAYQKLVNNKKRATKRLTACYKIIANCVNMNCSYFNESPSPYLTTLDKPLTIDPNSIVISEKFKDSNSIRSLFVTK